MNHVSISTVYYVQVIYIFFHWSLTIRTLVLYDGTRLYNPQIQVKNQGGNCVGAVTNFQSKKVAGVDCDRCAMKSNSVLLPNAVRMRGRSL